MSCPTQAIITKTIVFTINTRDPASGLAKDADSAPTYSVYEDETNTPIKTGSMTALGDGEVGHYSESLSIVTADGYEPYKSYSIRISAVVDTIVGKKEFSFNVVNLKDVTEGSEDSGTTWGYSTLGALVAKLEKLSADNNITFDLSDQARMFQRLKDSYNEIMTILMGRGLTEVQVSTFGRGAEFQLDIATYWYGRDSGWGTRLEEERDWIKVFDRRDELRDMTILDNSNNLLTKGKQGYAQTFDLTSKNKDAGVYH